MQPANGPGVVPRNADILTLGLSPDNLDSFEQMARHRLLRAHARWDCVVSHGKSFDHVIKDFVPNRPQLDLVYIANQVNLLTEDWRRGITTLTYELAKHKAKPWVILTRDLAHMAHFFHTRCINVQHTSIEACMTARHEKGCGAAHVAA